MQERNYYNEIKEELINNEVNRKIKDYSKNRSDLNTYYNVGKMLIEAGKHYGESIINQYSLKLTNELGKGYTISNLKRFRQFYLLVIKGATLSHQLTWSHYTELLPLNDINSINYYVLMVEQQKLTIRQLREKIKTKEYERLDNITRDKLITRKEVSVIDYVKNPIMIKNSYNYTEVSEKILQKLILEDIESFMKELGNSFSFIGSEYKIKIGDRYNYIDLLLFNIKYNAYVVVELKITKFKVEYISQVQKYMNYIDKNIKEVSNNCTIGILICKRENKFVIEYCSDDRIAVREYELV